MTEGVISIKTFGSRRVIYDKEAFPIYNNDLKESIILSTRSEPILHQ